MGCFEQQTPSLSPAPLFSHVFNMSPKSFCPSISENVFYILFSSYFLSSMCLQWVYVQVDLKTLRFQDFKSWRRVKNVLACFTDPVPFSSHIFNIFNITSISLAWIVLFLLQDFCNSLKLFGGTRSWRQQPPLLPNRKIVIWEWCNTLTELASPWGLSFVFSKK